MFFCPTEVSSPVPSRNRSTVVAARLRALSRQSGPASFACFFGGAKNKTKRREAFLRRHRPAVDVYGFGAVLIVREVTDPAAWIVSFLTSGSLALWSGNHLNCKVSGEDGIVIR